MKKEIKKLINNLLPEFIIIKLKNLKNNYFSVKDESKFEVRLGCEQIGNSFTIRKQAILVCCPSGEAKENPYFNVNFDGMNVKKSLLAAKKKSLAIIRQHKKGKIGFCNGCGYLTRKEFPIQNTNDAIINVVMQGTFKNDLCNIECIYCITKKRLKDDDSQVELLNVLKEVVNTNNGMFININFANGEFLARNDVCEILDYLAKQENVHISITSNASIYRESLVNIIKMNKVDYINVSLDAGTKKTYAKVKNRDLYNNVINNLVIYSNNKCQKIYLKYILLPDINDNIADIQGFINIANLINAHVTISVDSLNMQQQLPKHTIDMMFVLYEKAIENKLNCNFTLELFNEIDMLSIMKRLSGASH